jgi:penicillin-binding protein 1A
MPGGRTVDMNWKIPDWARWPSSAEGRVPWQAYARRIAMWSLLLVAVLIVAVVAWVAALIPTAPGVRELRALQDVKPSVLLSADGKPLTTFRQAQQERVTLDKISPNVVKALIATEDQRFFDHHGVDIYRTFGAAWHTLGGDTQGGSTITQQLARNLFPDDIGRSRTLSRKVKELITALRIERNFSKQQILENYLNSAPFLYNVVGIEMAARTYYDKPASQLSVLESATLIGMLKGTRYYNPILHPERAKERRNVVLAQMVRQKALDEPTYKSLRDAPLTVQFNRQPDMLGDAPHFAIQMRKWLIDWADEHDYNLYTDGLVIQTTIDSRLQAAATAAVEKQAKALQAVADVEWSSSGMRLTSTSPEAYVKAREKVEPFAFLWNKKRDLVETFVRETPEFKAALKKGGSDAAALHAVMADADVMARLRKDKTRLEAGFLAMDPDTGEVKAWVGSRDFDGDQFDHVALAARQPGSTFKPFVYGAALEAGISPDRTYIDQPVEIPLSDGTVWKPTDMSGTSGEMMTLRDGLAYSKNVITAQVAQEVGTARIAALARSMGVTQSKLDMVPSLALGTSPVTLLEMVTAYSTIAEQGQYHKPVMIKRISNAQGEVLAEFTGETRRAMSPDSAVDLIDMMRGVINRGTGTQIKTRFGIVSDIAGKTGTTQNNTDGWFILMHPNLVAGAWVGFNDSRVTMRSDYWGQGGHNAILLVGDFFKTALKAKLVDPKATFPPPRHPPMAPASAPADNWSVDPSESQAPGGQGEESSMPAVTSPNDVVMRRDGGGVIVIGDKASMTTSRPSVTAGPPKTSEELDRALQGMSRGTTGSVSTSGTGASQGAASSSGAASIGTGAPPPSSEGSGASSDGQ